MSDQSAQVSMDYDQQPASAFLVDNSPEVGCRNNTATADPGLTERSANKCPYLAGRQHLGTYHTAPSRDNRCYARPTPDKPHAGVSRDRQELLCLCSSETHERCRDYQSARLHGIQPPEFGGLATHDRTPNPQGPADACYKRVKHRHRRPPLARWWKRHGRVFLISAVFLLSSALFLTASAYILPALSGAGDGP